MDSLSLSHSVVIRRYERKKIYCSSTPRAVARARPERELFQAVLRVCKKEEEEKEKKERADVLTRDSFVIQLFDELQLQRRRDGPREKNSFIRRVIGLGH